MEQSLSSESNSRQATKEIICPLYNLKFRFRDRDIQLLVLILSQLNPVHTLTLYFRYQNEGAYVVLN